MGGVEGSRRHYGGNGAAEADEHGHDAVTSESELAQEAVADESHARHIAAVLQQAEEEKQQNYYRYKTENATHTAEDAVDNERLHSWTDIPVGQRRPALIGEPRDALVEPVLQRRAKDIDGKPNDAHHHQDENRDGRPFSRENFVNFSATAVLLAFLWLDYGSVTEFFDEGKSHFRHGGSTVKATFLFHLHDEVLQSLLLSL